MAADLGFMAAPNFMMNLARLEAQLAQDQAVDPVAIAMGVLAAVKALAPLGVRGFQMIKNLTGGSDDEVQQLIGQVQPGAQGSQVSTTTVATTPSPIQPRNIKFESPKLTPEDEAAVDVLKRIREEKYKIGRVECQVQQYERRQPPRPDDDDHDQLTRQLDKQLQQQQQQQQQAEQDYFDAVVANRNLGKAAACPQGVAQEVVVPDSWQGEMNETQQLQQSIRTKDAQLRSMETEMRRMQKELEEVKRIGWTQPTPTQQNISTPLAQGQDDAKPNAPTIIAGIINRRQPTTPNTGSSNNSSDTNGSANGLYRVTGGNEDGGDGNDGDPDGDGYPGGNGNNVGDNNYGRNTRRGEFMLVKASNITVATFTGTNLTANPYLQFYKSMRRLIYSQGEDGEILLKLLTAIEKKGAATFTNEQLEEEVKHRHSNSIDALCVNCGCVVH